MASSTGVRNDWFTPLIEGGKTWIYTGHPTVSPICVCQCGNQLEFSGLTMIDTAKKISNHLKSSHSGFCYPANSLVKQFLMTAFEGVGSASSLKMGLILPMDQPTAREVQQVLIDNNYKTCEKKICVRCFQEGGCSCVCQRMSVKGLYRPYQGFVAIPAREEWEVLLTMRRITDERIVAAFEPASSPMDRAIASAKRLSLLQQGLPVREIGMGLQGTGMVNDVRKRLQLEPGASAAAGTQPPETPSIVSRSNAALTPTPPPLTTAVSAQHSTMRLYQASNPPMLNFSQAPLSGEMIRESPEVVRIIDTPFTIHLTAQESLGILLTDGPQFRLDWTDLALSDDARSDAQPEAQTVESKAFRLLYPDLNRSELTPEERAQSAHLTRRLGNTQMESNLSLSLKLIVANARQVGDMFPIEMKAISEVFKTSSGADSARNPDHTTVLLSGGINVDLFRSTEDDYVCVMVKFFRIMLELQMPGHLLLGPALEECGRMQGHVTTAVQTRLFESVGEAILCILMGILDTPKLIMPSVIKYFLYTYIAEARVAVNTVNEDDDGAGADTDEDNAPQPNPDAATTPPQGTKMRSPNTLHGAVMAMLYFLKLTMVLFVNSQRKEMNASLARTSTDYAIQVPRLDPINMLMKRVAISDTLNLKSMALLSSQLKRLEELVPGGITNSCFLGRTPLNTLVIRWGKEEYTSDKLIAIGVGIRQTLLGVVKMLFRSRGEEDQQALTAQTILNELQNPRRGTTFDLHKDPTAMGHSCAWIDESQALIQKTLLPAVEHFIGSDPIGFHHVLDLFQEALFVALHWFMAGVFRNQDLSTICLAVAGRDENGVLFLRPNQFSSMGLMYLGLTSKNSRVALAMVPVWVSRILVLFLQILRPFQVAKVMTQFDQVVAAQSVDLESDLRFRVSTQVRLKLRARVGAIPELSPKLLKVLRGENVPANVLTFLQTKGSVVVKTFGGSAMASLLKRVLIQKAMESELTDGGLRKLLVVWKENIREFAHEHVNRTGSHAEKQALLSVHEELQVLHNHVNSINNFTGSGGHSMHTSMRCYQSPDLLQAERGIPVTEALSRTVLLQEAYMTLFTGAPFTQGPEQHATIVNPVHSRTIIGMFPLEQQANWKHLVQNQLMNFNMTEFLSNGQKMAALNIMKDPEDVAIFLPCGTGKTVACVLPLSLAPYGFALFVVPFRGLLESLLVNIRDKLGVACEVFDAAVEGRFSPNAFLTSRTNDDPVRIVLAVYDTAISPSCISFCQAAIARGLLNAIVIDEAHHLIVSRNFRTRVMNQAATSLTRLGTRIIVMSGTWTVPMERTLFLRLGRVAANFRIVREPYSLKGKQIVNFVPFPPVPKNPMEELVEYVIKLLASRVKVSGAYPVLLFSMTTHMNSFLKEQVRKTIGAEVVLLDGGCTRDEVQAFVGAFHDSKRRTSLVGVSTS